MPNRPCVSMAVITMDLLSFTWIHSEPCREPLIALPGHQAPPEMSKFSLCWHWAFSMWIMVSIVIVYWGFYKSHHFSFKFKGKSINSEQTHLQLNWCHDISINLEPRDQERRLFWSLINWLATIRPFDHDLIKLDQIKRDRWRHQAQGILLATGENKPKHFSWDTPLGVAINLRAPI